MALDTQRGGRPSWTRVARRTLFYVAVAVACSGIDWFGLERPARSRIQDVANQVFASWHDPPSKVAVVLVSDRTLEHEAPAPNSRLTWPVDYGFHARHLAQIARYKPKGVLIDVAFEDKREAPEGLRTGFEALASSGSPLVLACGAHCVCEALRDDMEHLLNETLGPGRFDLAPTPKITGQRDGIVRRYPLMLPIPTEHIDDESEKEFEGLRPSCRTAAFALYRLAKPLHGAGVTASQPGEVKAAMEADAKLFGVPMEIVWGAPPATDLVAESASEAVPSSPLRAFWRVLRGGEVRYASSPAPSIDAAALFQRDTTSDELARLLEDAYVIYGLDIAGVSDRFSGSVYTRQPGPFVHAVALDNLLSFDREYVRRARKVFFDVGSFDIVLAAIVGFLWALSREEDFWTLARNRLAAADGLAARGVRTLWPELHWPLAAISGLLLAGLHSILLPAATILIGGIVGFWWLGLAPINTAAQLFALGNVELALKSVESFSGLYGWMKSLRPANLVRFRFVAMLTRRRGAEPYDRDDQEGSFPS